MKLRAASLVALVVLVSTCLSIPRLADAADAPPNPNFNMVPITISNISLSQSGQLTANGLIGDQPFTAPVNLSLAEVQPLQATCPILNLSLGPIDLGVLGLVVETSAICLDITAQQGGGLLGDLLCSIANLLNEGNSLADILNDLSPNRLTRLTTGLTHLLNEVLSRVTSARAVTGVSGTDGLTTQQVDISCNILNLALGPIELKLLGLIVELDNCEGGPVTVDVTAVEGGGLLGDLLCNLAGLLEDGAIPGAITELLRDIARVISQLLN